MSSKSAAKLPPSSHRAQVDPKAYRQHQLPTIFALSTHMGKAGIAVIRISGPLAFTTLTAFGFTEELNKTIPRHLYHLALISPSTLEMLDDALVTYFPAPNSFTGQDIVEMHTHGSIAVVQDILSELSLLPNLKPAEPGEFTRLAFENGKMDLTKVEALADLLEAETSMQRKVAIQQLSGQLQKLYDGWRQKLINIMAQIEAYIDFPEDDIPEEALAKAEEGIKVIEMEISDHLKASEYSDAITHGINIGIIGKPNSGKSSLINTLSRQDIAIVSDTAGTTRDVLQTRMQMGGYAVVLYDTAGIRESTNVIEMEGVRRARRVGDHADIAMILVDLSEIGSLGIHDTGDLFGIPFNGSTFESMLDSSSCDADDSNIHNSFLERLKLSIQESIRLIEGANPKIIILNKIDMLPDIKRQILDENTRKLEKMIIMHEHDRIDSNGNANGNNSKDNLDYRIIAISARDGTNINELLEVIRDKISDRYRVSGEPMITKLRQKQRLRECLTQLQHIDIYHKPLELSAQDLRFAANNLEIITGKIELDEVLDEIFSTFCIGK